MLSRSQTIRILMDLQACQAINTGERGVGRYSKSLFQHMANVCGQIDLFALIPSDYKNIADINVDASCIRFDKQCFNWNSSRNFLGGSEDSLNELAYSRFVAPFRADILHISHVFEGYSEHITFPSYQLKAPGQLISATLFDLIPYIYQDHYLQDDHYRKWYLSRLNYLRQADLLLAISESSKRDAVSLLGIDPARIVTIYGGVSACFHQFDFQNVRNKLLEQYHIKKPFILYTAGDDYRKNIHKAIEGFAAVPEEIRKSYQFVIVCSMQDERKKLYLDCAYRNNLSAEDVLITGFISENDLVALYNLCDLFIFPSLYEGLGLPILEAMACGAPVIGGDNSSIKEIIGRKDALFNANSSSAIAEAISLALTQKAFLNDLRQYGLERVKLFSWEKTAKQALSAFEDALTVSKQAGIHASKERWMPRKRIALFTPLPPCRSGIAEYNAEFLPYLSRYFEIDIYVDYGVTQKTIDQDLASIFRVFDAKNFLNVVEQYDVILYEFGNSEFHAYMMPIFEKHPGIVVLHDAYLGGLFGCLDSYFEERVFCKNEMLMAHGPIARRLLLPNQNGEICLSDSIVYLPCTKKILNHALGVISHSVFNLEVARYFYPEGWLAPYRIIPQMIHNLHDISEEERQIAKHTLGFNQVEKIIVTFGHIVWTKWGDRLLEAFLNSPLFLDENVYLIYAGESSEDDFNIKLRESIKNSGLSHRIKITGFLSNEDYKRYLYAADLAVQLRTKSRGGTPKSVLDCLSMGVPVIVNNDASFRDYSPNVVIKVDANPSIQMLSQKINEILMNQTMRNDFINAGIQYVRENHSPVQCAIEYASAIHEYIERNKYLHPKHFASSCIPYLEASSIDSSALHTFSDWIDNIPIPSFGKRRRLLIDLSHISRKDHGTGIQRVVKQITNALYHSERKGFEPVAIQLIDGKFYQTTHWLKEQGLLLDNDTFQEDSLVDFQEGDILLMLDSSWEFYQDFFPLFEQSRQLNIPIYTVIYDLLPITLPKGNFVEGGREWFESWLKKAIAMSDGLIGISKTVANELLHYLGKQTNFLKKPKIGYWHLGANFAQSIGGENVNFKKLSQLKHLPFLMMVGTIEPRKSHDLILRAMEQLWAENHTLCLCIAGKKGWMVDELIVKLKNHPLKDKKLFFIECPLDKDIEFLYSKAAGLIFPSKGEGFGLPLVEAAHHGTPVLCSDIPVFREITGDYATYINIENFDTLVLQIKNWWLMKLNNQLPDITQMPRLSWEESAEALLDVIFKNNWIGN